MSRSPNDDRSDTMNPNNDAYWADQANRHGDDDPSDDYDSGSNPKEAKPPLGPDPRFGPDPHPVLGRRSNRLPGIPDLQPWTEELAISFATTESERRDRQLAIDELMSVAGWLLEQALAVIVRQGNVATVQRSGSDGDATITLTVGDAWGIVVRASKEFEVVFVEETKGEIKRIRVFRFSKLRWREAKPELRGLDRWQYRSARTPEEHAELAEARRRSQDVVGYYSEMSSYRAPDPAATIVALIRESRER